MKRVWAYTQNIELVNYSPNDINVKGLPWNNFKGFAWGAGSSAMQDGMTEQVTIHTILYIDDS